MGNCASVRKKAGPAMKFSCPIDSRGNCIHIESPVKGSSKVYGDHSMTEKLNSKPQSLSPKPSQASFHDMGTILTLFYHVKCPSFVGHYYLLSFIYPFF
jgi:hypothetical protein